MATSTIEGQQKSTTGILRDLYIDRIYDTFIDEEELQNCDGTIKEITDSLEKRPYSSREFIWEMGKWLSVNSVKRDNLIQVCFENNVPTSVLLSRIAVPALLLAEHAMGNPEKHVSIDSVADFLELDKDKDGLAGVTRFVHGRWWIPKNFAEDTVVCAEILGKEVPMHQYAVQITVADVRDGACSSSTLKEASSWGKGSGNR